MKMGMMRYYMVIYTIINFYVFMHMQLDVYTYTLKAQYVCENE